MRLSPTSRLQLTCLALSLISTGFLVTLDRQLTAQVETRRGEAYARQVVAQIQRLESVALFEAMPMDRLDRAVGWLNSTGASRMVRIELLTSRTPEWAADEGSHYLGWDIGEIVYWRWLKPERPVGVKITIALGYRGFLGARNPLTHDLGILGVALALFLFLYLFTGQLWGWKLYRGQAVFNSTWQREGRSMVHHLTQALREVVRQAKTLAVSANRSRAQITALQGQLEARIAASEEGDRARATLVELHKAVLEAQKPYQDLFATSRQLNEWITQTLGALQQASAHVEAYGQEGESEEARRTDGDKLSAS